jgi:hypothetical protein
MLTHAVSVTLAVAAAMFGSSDKRSLYTICADARMTERAARQIMGEILKQMVSKEEPRSDDFSRLVQSIAAIAKES